MSDDERDKFVAEEIKAGRCPFGMLGPSETDRLFICSLGLPGCACADELLTNKYLREMLEEAIEGSSR